MSSGGFVTPEEAALSGFDRRYARVVETRFYDEDNAEVELATNEEPITYPYWVRVLRRDDVWYAGTDGNGPSARWR